MHHFWTSSRNLYCTLLLGIITVIGDYFVVYSKLHIFQAIFDNATHALIGALSWLMVCLNFPNREYPLIEIGLCAVIASLIDLDHFVAAKSIYLKDATSLSHRPFLHCSTVPLVLCLFLILVGYALEKSSWTKLSLILLTAFASHHTRDATRRGFWFYPLGSTQPVPYFLYITLTCAIPYAICLLYSVTIYKERFIWSSLERKQGSVII